MIKKGEKKIMKKDENKPFWTFWYETNKEEKDYINIGTTRSKEIAIIVGQELANRANRVVLIRRVKIGTLRCEVIKILPLPKSLEA